LNRLGTTGTAGLRPDPGDDHFDLDNVQQSVFFCRLLSAWGLAERGPGRPRGSAFVEGEEVFACFLAIFVRLKAEPNAIDLVCTGHFDTLQKLFCTDKTAGRVAQGAPQAPLGPGGGGLVGARTPPPDLVTGKGGTRVTPPTHPPPSCVRLASILMP